MKHFEAPTPKGLRCYPFPLSLPPPLPPSLTPPHHFLLYLPIPPHCSLSPHPPFSLHTQLSHFTTTTITTTSPLLLQQVVTAALTRPTTPKPKATSKLVPVPLSGLPLYLSGF
ncbi:hypothetical protein E2C01_100165 [Portunus trituberculatus]|uniref:Uncharacterized protein n=1 Tax=Portunus trituberculatus TaxID=210409 RepID=A0A5B7KIP6_PORTR|nr:hypothetical protein [Portunus trituberculatus]